jgi:hypothetical protein
MYIFMFKNMKLVHINFLAINIYFLILLLLLHTFNFDSTKVLNVQVEIDKNIHTLLILIFHTI